MRSVLVLVLDGLALVLVLVLVGSVLVNITVLYYSFNDSILAFKQWPL